LFLADVAQTAKRINMLIYNNIIFLHTTHKIISATQDGLKAALSLPLSRFFVLGSANYLFDI
jgi:hypothetical protein